MPSATGLNRYVSRSDEYRETEGSYTFRWTNGTADDYAIACVALTPTGGLVNDSHTSPSGNWWNSSWTKRTPLLFDNSAQSENLTDFPVLVKLDNSRVDYAQTQNAGQDIRFVDSDGTTVLDHEIEEWNESGTSSVWVKVPQIDGSSNTDYIWLYYGNSGAGDGQDVSGTWNSGYEAVYHLHDDYLDSTSHSVDGTNNGAADTTGTIGDAEDFVRSQSDHVDLGNPSAFDFGTGNWTLSGWFKTTDSSNKLTIVGNGGDESGGIRWVLFVNENTGTKLTVTADDNSTKHQVDSTTTVTDGNWHWATAVRNGTTIELFVNGASEGSTACAAGYSLAGTSQKNAYIGALRSQGSGSLFKHFDGDLDEIRVQSTARSSDWIAAQYLSMTDAMITFGGTSNNGTSAGAMTGGDLVTGQIADGLDLDGTDDRVVIPDAADFDFGTGAFTMSMWFKKIEEDRGDVFNWKTSSGADDIGIILSASETMDVYFRVNSSGGMVVNNGSAFTVGDWHLGYIVRAASGGAITTYINGASDGSGTSTLNVDNVDGGTPLWFGANGGSSTTYGLQATIDECRLANIARSADWITVQHLSMTDDFIRWTPQILSWEEVEPD